MDESFCSFFSLLKNPTKRKNLTKHKPSFVHVLPECSSLSGKKFSLQQKSFADSGQSLFIFALYMFILGPSPSVMRIPGFVRQNAREECGGSKARMRKRDGKVLLACNLKPPSRETFKALVSCNVFTIFSVRPSILRSWRCV